MLVVENNSVYEIDEECLKRRSVPEEWRVKEEERGRGGGRKKKRKRRKTKENNKPPQAVK